MTSCLCKGSGSSLPFQPHPNSYHPIHNNKGHLGGMLAQKLRSSATSPEPQKVTTSLCVNWWDQTAPATLHPRPSLPHIFSQFLFHLYSVKDREQVCCLTMGSTLPSFLEAPSTYTNASHGRHFQTCLAWQRKQHCAPLCSTKRGGNHFKCCPP